MYAFEALVTYAGREAMSTRTFQVEASQVNWGWVGVVVPFILGVGVVFLFKLRTPKIEKYDKLVLEGVKKRVAHKKKKSHK